MLITFPSALHASRRSLPAQLACSFRVGARRANLVFVLAAFSMVARFVSPSRCSFPRSFSLSSLSQLFSILLSILPARATRLSCLSWFFQIMRRARTERECGHRKKRTIDWPDRDCSTRLFARTFFRAFLRAPGSLVTVTYN